MPRYRVKMTYMTDVDIDVEAENPEAAKEAARVEMLEVEPPEVWTDEYEPTRVTLLAPTDAKPLHAANGGMTEEAHAAYLAAIKPVMDLRGTEHDAWKWSVERGLYYEPDEVWQAAVLTSDVLTRAFHESYADGEPAEPDIDIDIDDMATWE